MSNAAQLQVSTPAPGILAMSGDLVFATAARALVQVRGVAARGEVNTLDLAGIGACDSAGLAVLLALAGDARKRGVTLHIINTPETLRALAQLAEVNGLLGFA